MEDTSTDWYVALTAPKAGAALEAIQRKWDLEEGQAKAVVCAIWSSTLIPKIKASLWLLVLQALPTIEHCGEWLTEMASAIYPHYVTPNLNMLDHVFCTCVCVYVCVCVWR